MKKTTDQFIKEAISVHNNKYDYSQVEYNGTHIPVLILCKQHGGFLQAPINHLKGQGCPRCNLGSIYNLTTDQWIKRAVKVHGNRYDYSKVDYKDCNTPVYIICKQHGIFKQRPRSHITGKGCPRCHLKSQNILFEKLISYFNHEEFIWEYTDNWLDKQRIDIYMPKYKIAIEYQGEQHFHPIKIFKGEKGFKIRQIRDKLKMEKCLNNNIKLFYINYNYTEDEFNNLVNNIKEIIEKYKNQH